MIIKPTDSVCVVGNGPSAIGGWYGDEIDKFDHVIRINNFDTEKHPKRTGTKTTIWAANRNSMNISRHNVLLKMTKTTVACDGIDVEISVGNSLGSIMNHVKHRASWIGISPDKIIPTTGIIVINWLLNEVGVNKVFVVGFDHFSKKTHKNHHYWETIAMREPVEHSGIIEADMFYELERAGRIEYINRGDAKAPTERRRLFFECEWDTDKKLSGNRSFPIACLPRSGSHLVAGWISSQLDGNALFASGINMMHNRKNNPLSFRKNKIHKSVSDKPKDSVDYISTLEWYPVNQKIEIPWIGAKNVPILLIRSPYNWMASLRSHNTGVFPNNGPERLTEMWKEFARRFIGKDDSFTRIYYDAFVGSIEYRDMVAERIGVDIRSDITMNRVSSYGGGSSFDGVLYNGNASEMKVSKRWHEYKTYQWMIDLLNDSEASDLHKEIEHISKQAIKA